jgi:hypothetical protein
VDQTDAEKRADLFRVHLLRRRGLMTEVAPKRTPNLVRSMPRVSTIKSADPEQQLQNFILRRRLRLILLHFKQVCFEQVLVIILTDIDLRRPICDRQAGDIPTAYSIRTSAQETIVAILPRFFHLFKLITRY